MRFFMQLGHGMRSLNRDLLRQFAGGLGAGVVLGPRVVDRQQNEKHAAEVNETGASVLFDPCFYDPHTTRESIRDYPYWDGLTFDTNDFSGTVGADFCRRVIDYQVTALDVTEVILPGRFTNTRSDDWLEMHRLFADTADQARVGRKVYSTVALGPDLIADRPSLDAVLNEVTAYPVDGVYLLYRPAEGEYLTTSQPFLLGLLDLGLSLSLAGKDVIVGYANQQDLVLGAVGVKTIASGNYRNVRRFDPTNFQPSGDAVKNRATWYYDGRSLSEFRQDDLTVAYQRLGLQGQFGPSTVHAEAILSAANPATVPWPEADSFKHYLTVLRDQWHSFAATPRATRGRTVNALLDTAHAQQQVFAISQLGGFGRSAATAVTAYRQALTTFLSVEAARVSVL